MSAKKFRQKVSRMALRRYGAGIMGGRRTYVVDEIRHGVLLAVDGERLGSKLEFEIVRRPFA